MKMKIILATVLFLTLSSCGFKIVNQNYLEEYKFIETNISGDNRIAYLLKNKLNTENKSASKLIKLDIISTKEKSIKEKNIQNEITKYNILIKTNVKFNLIEDNKFGEFKVEKSGNYIVGNRYSNTLNNEKKLLVNLVNDTADQIIKNIALKINDF